MRSHLKGEYLGKSRLGLSVFRSLCGATDSHHSTIVQDISDATCERCVEILKRKGLDRKHVSHGRRERVKWASAIRMHSR